ncbi:hypothetical protein PAMA_016724 [Pampus argenteus]
MKINNMSFTDSHELKIRVKPKDNCSSFAINIGHDSENIAMHFNPRFDYGNDHNVIIFNSLSGGNWANEQRDDRFPFKQGEECKFFISYNNEQFHVKLPDGSVIDFPNRLGDVKYSFFDVSGDAKIIGIKLK